MTKIKRAKVKVTTSRNVASNEATDGLINFELAENFQGKGRDT